MEFNWFILAREVEIDLQFSFLLRHLSFNNDYLMTQLSVSVIINCNSEGPR